MESVLLFTEGDEARFVFSEWFDTKMKELNPRVAAEIVNQITHNINSIPKKDALVQTICGVVKSDSPFFFELEFVNEPEYIPVFVDAYEISLEEYLDSITENKYFKDEQEQTIKSE